MSKTITVSDITAQQWIVFSHVLDVLINAEDSDENGATAAEQNLDQEALTNLCEVAEWFEDAEVDQTDEAEEELYR